MRRVLLPGVVMAVLAAAWLGGAGPRFLPDDPLAVEPETQDASKAAPRDIDLIWDVDGTFDDFPADETVRLERLSGVDDREGTMVVRSKDGITLVLTDAVFNMDK